MTFTALHRALGVAPEPLTDELLDDAVTTGMVEADDLDWKLELPPVKGLPQTDFRSGEPHRRYLKRYRPAVRRDHGCVHHGEGAVQTVPVRQFGPPTFSRWRSRVR
ncbi:hypothetical protein LZG04_11865 [Saccharothrix sp. S26]|uniref:hypothetical protein n=1 Tax=Saccharothrix sp. S26 TaxID=2907215 RepID=UPI001F2948D0|nr:hypothetical protein [Saccharothrix sp. S26]MCE6995494.1 hypothetical protein [Saccharothrix sp. S26]